MSKDFDDFQQARQEANRGWRTMRDAFDKAQGKAETEYVSEAQAQAQGLGQKKIRRIGSDEVLQLAARIAAQENRPEEQFLGAAKTYYRGGDPDEDILRKG